MHVMHGKSMVSAVFALFALFAPATPALGDGAAAIMSVLESWGPWPASAPSAADRDGDGVVGPMDLLDALEAVGQARARDTAPSCTAWLLARIDACAESAPAPRSRRGLRRSDAGPELQRRPGRDVAAVGALPLRASGPRSTDAAARALAALDWCEWGGAATPCGYAFCTSLRAAHWLDPACARLPPQERAACLYDHVLAAVGADCMVRMHELHETPTSLGLIEAALPKCLGLGTDLSGSPCE